jgi:hypothetical protein
VPAGKTVGELRLIELAKAGGDGGGRNATAASYDARGEQQGERDAHSSMRCRTCAVAAAARLSATWFEIRPTRLSS